jgi:hypothetical protein
MEKPLGTMPLMSIGAKRLSRETIFSFISGKRTVLGMKPINRGNVTQRRFRLTGNSLIFDNPLILKVYG